MIVVIPGKRLNNCAFGKRLSTVNFLSDGCHLYHYENSCKLLHYKIVVMLQTLQKEFAEVLDVPGYLPCISIVMPFDPKMNLHTELAHKLKIAVSKIEVELRSNYPEDKLKPVLEKLKRVINNLYYDTHKKTIAIFVSPLVEKIYYLDIPVEEKVIIDDSFEIRDLIYSKKQIHKFLLVELNSKWTKIYMGNGTQFIKVVSNRPANVAAYQNDIPEQTGNFSDRNKRKEVMLDKFLQHTDNGLGLLLQAYDLPLFVMGTERTVGHFKKITRHADRVVRYIPGNYEHKTEAELWELMSPFIADWKTIMQADLLKQINSAADHKKLVTGINEVWKAAAKKRGRLLIVEKNYIHPAQHGAVPEIIYSNSELLDRPFFIKDAVDDIIEKVLANGGDVEFVDEGFLQAYNKIALIEYYESI